MCRREEGSYLVAPRGTTPAARNLGGAVSDDDDAPHVYLMFQKMIEVRKDYLLVIRTHGGSYAHGCCARPVFSKDCGGLYELFLPGGALRVVDGYDEIGLGHGFNPFSYNIPGDKEIAHADRRVIAHQGCTEPGRCGICCRYARHNFYWESHTESLGELKRQPRHAVDAGISRGDEGHPVSASGAVEGGRAPLDLLRHPRRNDFLSFRQVMNEREVAAIAYDGAAPGDRILSAPRPV